tara:strand:+ start:88 stop:315 length:228 start_codon:yes stop_codon:yes gene_type:complete
MIEHFYFSLILFNLSPLFAYIGPGMGGGVIAAIFGIIAAFFLGLWGILYYPIKRAFKNKKKNKKILSKNKNKNRK